MAAADGRPRESREERRRSRGLRRGSRPGGAGGGCLRAVTQLHAARGAPRAAAPPLPAALSLPLFPSLTSARTSPGPAEETLLLPQHAHTPGTRPRQCPPLAPRRLPLRALPSSGAGPQWVRPVGTGAGRARDFRKCPPAPLQAPNPYHQKSIVVLQWHQPFLPGFVGTSPPLPEEGNLRGMYWALLLTTGGKTHGNNTKLDQVQTGQ
ncbi:uncharacterized protein LOC110403998 [Numida meleagris]|uniref:uncharacterized protein LOC110403998 n=1 Tax=Numida meleagris TaxID=8996 RepID=UPI000B3D93DC|nr:uncharacterized protein LOC110403998 [Numida meleagris]